VPEAHSATTHGTSLQVDAIVKQQASWTIPDAKLKAGLRRVIKQVRPRAGRGRKRTASGGIAHARTWMHSSGRRRSLLLR
jgi:hypothetical protein